MAMSDAQIAEITDKLLKESFNADHTTLYQDGQTACLSVAMNFTIKLGYRDIELRPEDLLRNIQNKFENKLVSSTLFKQEMAIKDQKYSELENNYGELKAECERLKQYETFYKLYKDLK